MNNYRFRANWRGKLILQRRITYYNINTWGRDTYWRDATTQDLKDYYKELYATNCN